MSRDDNIKKIVKTVGVSAASGVIFGSGIVGAAATRNAIDKSVITDAETVQEYEEQNYLRAKADGKDYSYYEDIQNKHKKIENLEELVYLSEYLNDLKLPKNAETVSSEDGMVYSDPKYVYRLIEEYSLRPTTETANELSDIEAAVNKKIYDGYVTLEDYGLATTKTFLADMYGGKEDDYTIALHDVNHDGYKEIIGPGYKELKNVDKDIYDYIDVLNYVYKTHGATDNPEPEKYNSARNKAVLSTIYNYNDEAADIIKDIEKSNKHK